MTQVIVEWGFFAKISVLIDRCPYTILTSPAVSHGHFAHPGLSNGGTRYCVLGRFLDDVPRSGLQTPLIATGFVSPGAGSPLTPLPHLAALCTG